jgi:hypothetical protein
MVPEPTTTSWQQAPAATENPMAIHVKVIAILELVWGVLAALGALFAIFVFSTGAALFRSTGDAETEWLANASAGLGFVIAAILGTLAVIAILGAVKLLGHKRSGKTLTFVSAAISLISFPIGTAFGIYAFIILTRPDTDRLLTNP